MVATLGLTHLALAVKDPERSLRFYREVLGARVTYRDEDTIEVQTPRRKDVISLERDARNAGRPGGAKHFGFRLRSPRDIDSAAEAVRRGGGRVVRRGEFSRGHPYLFARDPDGYEIEIWYE